MDSRAAESKAATSAHGSAQRWGPLWGARAEDWARSEERQRPVYEEAIRQVGLEPGQRVLDVGCGAGAFLALAAEHGAEPTGIDASTALLEIARRRVPGADLRCGEMEQLPYEDDRFHLVTGFTSFFFAADLVAALREAGRVAQSGAPIFIQVWGRPERCELEAMKVIVRPFMPPAPKDAAAPPPLWQPGVLEALAAQAGLSPTRAFDFRFAYEYPDEVTLGRELMAPMGLGELAGAAEEEVRAAVVAAMSPYRSADGSYRIENEFRCLIAGAA